MNKFEKERELLKVAKPLLLELYGEFEVDPNQGDRPDAAIILKPDAHDDKKTQESIKIGIEITSIDNSDDLQYLNDEKFTRAKKNEQINRIIEGREIKNQPDKKVSILFKNTYIYDGVLKKIGKYLHYAESDNYKEIIVLVFSEFFTFNDQDFNNYHISWTNYFLSEIAFPFDKVIFVCEKTEKSILVYTKNTPRRERPMENEDMESGITVATGPIIQFGKAFNINDLFEQEPLFKKNKSQQKEKEK